MSKDLFKQAIAEAKSVREAAIANAKDALEETLTPHIKDMLAAKLQEMEDASEEEVVKEEEVSEEEVSENAVNEENPTEDLEEQFTFEEEEEDDVDIDSEESEEDAEEAELEAEEEIEVKDMEVSDLKDLIRDIIAQEVGVDSGEEEIPTDEIPDEEIPADDMMGVDDEEEIDLDELLREITEMSDESKDESYSKKSKEVKEEEVSEQELKEDRPGYGVSDFGDPMDNELIKAIAHLAEQAKKAGKKLIDYIKGLEGSQINEQQAVKTVNEMKKQLQETNLLNAKLLYVNKVFKSRNLTESQKVNVIAAFDKAETVKEAKLVFETFSENLDVKSNKQSVVESKLGMASKPTGITAKKPEIISEVSDAVKRMQKLAGIIK